MPERYGMRQSVHHRFNRFRKNGAFDRVLKSLRFRLDEDRHIGWDPGCIDGTSVRARSGLVSSRALAG